MVQKISKGDRVTISGKVSRVWPNGLISLYLDGLDYPVTLHEKYLDEVVKAPKEPKPRFKRKFYDNPD